MEVLLRKGLEARAAAVKVVVQLRLLPVQQTRAAVAAAVRTGEGPLQTAVAAS